MGRSLWSGIEEMLSMGRDAECRRLVIAGGSRICGMLAGFGHWLFIALPIVFEKPSIILGICPNGEVIYEISYIIHEIRKGRTIYI